VGRRHKGKRIRLYVAGLDVRIVTWDGELLRHLVQRFEGVATALREIDLDGL
jgi:hypothetical protein